jgi:hypothetical protein
MTSRGIARLNVRWAKLRMASGRVASTANIAHTGPNVAAPQPNEPQSRTELASFLRSGGANVLD